MLVPVPHHVIRMNNSLCDPTQVTKGDRYTEMYYINPRHQPSDTSFKGFKKTCVQFSNNIYLKRSELYWQDLTKGETVKGQVQIILFHKIKMVKTTNI